MKNKRIPVTIITGFLGSGKTTLLNQLIKKHPEKKFAIIENEFGETGIDGGLIKTTPDTIFELSSGCICCSLGEDFLFTLENLLGSSYEFDHLLIETTGIADPISIIDSFVSGTTVQERFQIDSVICIIDAVNVEDLIDKQPEVRKQLAVSDLILINKSDCIQPEHLMRIEEFIKNINPTGSVFTTKFSNVNTIPAIDIQSFSREAIEQSAMNFCRIDQTKTIQKQSFIHNPTQTTRHKHDICSFGFSFKGSFDVNKFGHWIQNYLYFNQDCVYRVKGIMSFDQTEDQFIFHSVRSSFMFEVGKPWNDEERFSKLVFIGKDLNAEYLEANLKQLLTKEADID